MAGIGPSSRNSPQQVWSRALCNFWKTKHKIHTDILLRAIWNRKRTIQTGVSLTLLGKLTCATLANKPSNISSSLANRNAILQLQLSCFVQNIPQAPQCLILRLKILARRCEGYTTYDNGTYTHLAGGSHQSHES